MASYIANSVLNDSIRQIKSNQNDSKQKIDWDDFNYPPLIKVIHYNIEEVQPEYRLVVRSLWLSSILIVAYTLLNIINNSIQAGNGIDGIRILYSFMFLFSFNPIQFFIFYRGYKGIVSDPYLLVLYKWVQIILILCWITFSIVAILGFNGFIILQYLFEFLPFCGVLALFEDIVSTLKFFQEEISKMNNSNTYNGKNLCQNIILLICQSSLPDFYAQLLKTHYQQSHFDFSTQKLYFFNQLIVQYIIILIYNPIYIKLCVFHISSQENIKCQSYIIFLLIVFLSGFALFRIWNIKE